MPQTQQKTLNAIVASSAVNRADDFAEVVGGGMIREWLLAVPDGESANETFERTGERVSE